MVFLVLYVNWIFLHPVDKSASEPLMRIDQANVSRHFRQLCGSNVNGNAGKARGFGASPNYGRSYISDTTAPTTIGYQCPSSFSPCSLVQLSQTGHHTTIPFKRGV